MPAASIESLKPKPAVQTVADLLRPLGACSGARAWASSYPAADAQRAWDACDRGDWMLWLLGTQAGPPESAGRKPLVLAACECARLALPHTQDSRALTCIEVAERWARGEAAIAELREAQSAAAAYAYAAAAYAAAAYAYAAAAYAAAADAAYAAADAAYAAADAAYAAADAAYAADATAAAATAAADAAYVRKKSLVQCAVIVRRHYPTAPTITGA